MPPVREESVIKVLQDLLKKRPKDLLNAEMNAYLHIVEPATHTHVQGLVPYAPGSRRRRKAVVWTHYGHVEDARYTEMGMYRGEISIGQRCRERYGESAVIIGTRALLWRHRNEVQRFKSCHR